MRLRRIAALGVVALVTAALPALAMPSQAATPVPTPTSPFTYTAAIEDPAAYDGQTICSPAPKPGTLKLRSLLLTTYGPASADISRPCSEGGQSEHKEGRAIDWMLSYNVPAERVKVQAFLAWLLAPDKFGNKAAMARRLGVMYMGWDNMFWRSYGQMGWGDLKGCSTDPALKASSYDTFCHRNHLHISLSWDGASGLTSYWTGWVIPPPCVAPYGSASTRAGAGATFVPVTPARILDTRLGTGLAGPCRATVPATWDTTGHDVVLKAVGVGGVPATGVASVALRVTATRPSALPLTVLSRSTAGVARLVNVPPAAVADVPHHPVAMTLKATGEVPELVMTTSPLVGSNTCVQRTDAVDDSVRPTTYPCSLDSTDTASEVADGSVATVSESADTPVLGLGPAPARGSTRTSLGARGTVRPS